MPETAASRTHVIEEVRPIELPEVLSQDGTSLLELSRRGPVLVVFLRHAGCTFCKRALSDITKAREEIESAGTSIALVHMMDEQFAQHMFSGYRLTDLPRFSDKDRRLYEAFGVGRGTAWQVMGPPMWGAAVCSILSGHLPGVPKGDLRQLSGAALFVDGRIVKEFVPTGSADRPDYRDLAIVPAG